MGSLDKLGSRRSSRESQRVSEREEGLRERRQALRAGPESRSHTTAQQSVLGCVTADGRVTWRPRLRAGQPTIRKIQAGLSLVRWILTSCSFPTDRGLKAWAVTHKGNRLPGFLFQTPHRPELRVLQWEWGEPWVDSQRRQESPLHGPEHRTQLFRPGPHRAGSYPGECRCLFEDFKCRVCKFVASFLRSVGCR